MSVPPVFDVKSLTPDLIDDLRQASQTYWNDGYTHAFDELFTVPERADLIRRFLSGDTTAGEYVARLRDWLLAPWRSARSLGGGRMDAVALALEQVRPTVAAIPDTLHLDGADSGLIRGMAGIFRQVYDCAGVGPTIASKILAPLRPALFPIWDNPIAEAYGFALNPAGYHQFLRTTQGIGQSAREFWRLRFPTPLEDTLHAKGRSWVAPLAKVIDEWNWIRITRAPGGKPPKNHTESCPAGGR